MDLTKRELYYGLTTEHILKYNLKANKMKTLYDYFESAICMILGTGTAALILWAIIGIITRNNLPYIAY